MYIFKQVLPNISQEERSFCDGIIFKYTLLNKIWKPWVFTYNILRKVINNLPKGKMSSWKYLKFSQKPSLYVARDFTLKSFLYYKSAYQAWQLSLALLTCIMNTDNEDKELEILITSINMHIIHTHGFMLTC